MFLESRKVFRFKKSALLEKEAEQRERERERECLQNFDII